MSKSCLEVMAESLKTGISAAVLRFMVRPILGTLEPP